MMTRILTQPIGQFATDVDRLFDTLLNQAVRQQFGQPLTTARPGILPPVNIWEDDQNVVLEAEVPGMAMEDLELLVHDGQITIRGQRQSPPQAAPERQRGEEAPEGARVGAQGGVFLRRERWHGQFERTISLPAPVDHEQAQASLLHGVLTVVLPKAASARPRKIEIRTSQEVKPS